MGKTDIENMTYKQFMNLPRKKWDKDVICDTIIIIPHNISKKDILKYSIRKWLNNKFPEIFKMPEIYEISGMHDSGYRLMSYVLCKDYEALCITDGGDVLHIDGIGGFGYNWLEKQGRVPFGIPPAGWTIDCLSPSGFLRLWCNENILVSNSLSSQEIFRIEKKKE